MVVRRGNAPRSAGVSAVKSKSVPASAQCFQPIHVTRDKSFLLRARPLLDLRLSMARPREISVKFYEEHFDRRINLGSPATLTTSVMPEARFCIIRAANIKRSRSKAKNVNDRDASRQARGHSTRFLYK
jgi:hypothetical protein